MRGLRYALLILQRLGFPQALTQTLLVLASSCLPQQIFNFSSNLLTRFEKAAKEFASDAQTHKKYSQNCKYIYDSSFMTVNLQSERSHFSRSESESCNVSALHG